jgi:hypothetical protein
MCLPVSRLFWVLSLTYPNLLGTKGYVVVVVVAAAYLWRLPCTLAAVLRRKERGLFGSYGLKFNN